MPRIVGVDIPQNKRVEVALTYIFGIGTTSAKKILSIAGINPDVRAKDLKDEEISRIASIIQKDHKVEGDLRRDIANNIKRMMDINCYVGQRHKKGLPVHGQRTRTNARTAKGPKRSGLVGSKKKTK